MDDSETAVPGALGVRTALKSDPLFRLLGVALERPLVLGAVLALLAVVAVIFGPASGARFIYTDF